MGKRRARCGEDETGVGCGEGPAKNGEGSLLISPARATRGLRRPSLDARSGRPSRPPSREEKGASLEGWGESDQVPFRARGTPTMKLWSFDARSTGYSSVVGMDDLWVCG